MIGVTLDDMDRSLPPSLSEDHDEPMLELDPQVDMAYLFLIPREARVVDDTLIFADERFSLAWGINLDFDRAGHLVGIEFEGPNEHVPPKLLVEAKRI